MNNDRKPLIKLHINVIIGFWSFLVYVGVFVTSFIRPDFFGNALPFIRIGFAFLIVVAAGIFGAEVKVFRSRYLFFKSLQDENSYTLGVRATFYNLEAFKNKVRSLEFRPSLRNKQKYVLVFSPTASKTINVSRIKAIQSLNRSIASFIDKIMVTKDNIKFSRKNAVYAFDRNNFIFYLFANEEDDVHQLISQISNECFRLVAQEKVNIWVQPFSGICKVSDNEKSITSLIEKATIAKLRAEDNIESVAFFKEAFIDNDYYNAEDIIRGIEHHDFIPYYQAKYSLKRKEIISAEALARWKTPEGVLSPAKFIERARSSGLLNKIDLAIFEAAMKDLGDSLKRGRRRIPISVNFSIYEFFSDTFVDRIISVLDKYNVPYSLLEIEVTETGYLTNLFKSIQTIKKLKDKGISILMDDFGALSSNIENFRNIQFDGIKIDKKLIEQIVADEKSRSIVKFLVQLIHENQMEVIVEGVETKEQVDILRQLKVDTIQGFYFAKPLPFDEYQKLLKENAFEKKGSKKWFSL